jgi:hypothetical protein
MKIKDEHEYLLDALSSPKFKKFLKIGVIVASIASGIYIIGHLFKISAHTIRGLNELKSALRNG